jgi:zinc transport system ATP-binding protein
MSKIDKQIVVNVSHLSFSYNSHPVIEDIDFSLERGDYVWVIGPNGSGKTTLVKVLLNILEPYQGKITLFGKDLSQFHEWHRVSYVPQKLSFFDPYFPATAVEVVTMGLLAEKKHPKKLTVTDKKRVAEVFEHVGISGIMKQRVGELSGGQLQRVLLARSLIMEPELVFLDEPTSAVEPGVREEFFRVIDAMNERGTTIMLINHDIGSAGIKNNKILYLNRKQLFFGSGRDFCLSEDMGEYFGSSQHLVCHQHLEEGEENC